MLGDPEREALLHRWLRLFSQWAVFSPSETPPPKATAPLQPPPTVLRLDEEVREALRELNLASREVDTRPLHCSAEELLQRTGRYERALRRWHQVRELAEWRQPGLPI